MLIHEALCRDFETLDPENLRQEIRSVIERLRGKAINSLPSGLVSFNPSTNCFSFDESKAIEMEEDKFLKQFYVAKRWLHQFKPSDLMDRMNGNRSSQKLKDIPENWSGTYVSNHALILAATALNIPFKKADHDSRVVFFYLRQPAIKRLEKEAGNSYELRSTTLQNRDIYVW